MKPGRGLYRDMDFLDYLYVFLCIILAAAIYSALDLFFEYLSKKLEERRDKKRLKEVRELENRAPNVIIDSARLSHERSKGVNV